MSLQATRISGIDARRPLLFVSGPIAVLWMVVLIFITPTSTAASATNIYLAQNAAGAANGSDCADAYAYSFFNGSTNWGSGTTQIGPGTTVHICGTITGTAGSTALTFHGSGTSSNPITLKFETGSKMLAPYWGGGFPGRSGAITATGTSYITIDGGTNGLIQSTLSGTSGFTCPGGPCQYQPNDDAGVWLNSCSNCVVKNLTIADMYDHQLVSDENGSGSGIGADAGSNLTFDHNVIHDSYYGIWYDYAGTNGNITFSNNDISHCNGNMVVASMGNNDNVTNLYVFGNSVHDDVNWNDIAYHNHHDGIHFWSTQAGTKVTNAQVYNNYWYGDMGAATAMVYMENYSGGTNTIQVFNNLFVGTAFTGGGGPGGLWLQTSSPGDVISAEIYNNTFLSTNNSASAIRFEGSTGIQADLRNNIVDGWAWLLDVQPGAPLPVTSDYNDWYFAAGGGGIFNENSGATYIGLGSWQGATGMDAHSASGDPKLSATYTLQSGSVAIAVGTNLTSLRIGALDSDKAGVARPLSGAWDAGAYRYNASTPSPPTGLTVTVQ